jgi:hypothetical protein
VRVRRRDNDFAGKNVAGADRLLLAHRALHARPLLAIIKVPSRKEASSANGSKLSPRPAARPTVRKLFWKSRGGRLISTSGEVRIDRRRKRTWAASLAAISSKIARIGGLKRHPPPPRHRPRIGPGLIGGKPLAGEAAEIIFGFEKFEVEREIVGRRVGDRARGQGQADFLRDEISAAGRPRDDGRGDQGTQGLTAADRHRRRCG